MAGSGLLPGIKDWLDNAWNYVENRSNGSAVGGSTTSGNGVNTTVSSVGLDLKRLPTIMTSFQDLENHQMPYITSFVSQMVKKVVQSFHQIKPVWTMILLQVAVWKLFVAFSIVVCLSYLRVYLIL